MCLKAWQVLIKTYKEDRLPWCFNTGLLSHDQIDNILTNHVEKNEKSRKSFVVRLVTRMEEETFLFVSPESPVAPYLWKEFSTLELNDLLQNLDITALLYTALFKIPLPTDDESSRITAIKHLQAIWPNDSVYFPQDVTLKQKGVRQFFQQKKDDILKELNNENLHYPYYSFLSPDADFKPLQDKAHTIIVTDEQLLNPIIKAKLEELFRANPEHMLLLSIGDDRFVQNGCLYLSKENLPTSVKHLRVIDATNSVTSIGYCFLFYCINLTSIDISGLKKVTSIGEYFLSNCAGLTSLDASRLKQVTSIGNGFLTSCTGLTSFDTSWLKQVTSIGGGFLSGCKNLTSFDASWLRRVTSIGSGFLCCSGLTSFDTSGLKQVKSIGNNFLYGCTGLTSFSTIGLKQVKSIGHNFLYGCTGLTSFDTFGLKNIKTIGNNFLYGCNNLIYFNIRA